MENKIEINFLEIRNHHEFQFSKPVISTAWLRSGICGPGVSTLRSCCLVPHAPQHASLISQGAGLSYAPSTRLFSLGLPPSHLSVPAYPSHFQVPAYPSHGSVPAYPRATFQSLPTPATFPSQPGPATFHLRPNPAHFSVPAYPSHFAAPATFQSRPTSTTFQSWPTPATFQFLPTPATFQSLPTSATFQSRQHLQSSASLPGTGLTNQCLSPGFQTWHMKPPTESYSVLQTEE